MAPLDIVAVAGTTGAIVVYLLIGFAFGFILESVGFGDSRKLAGQFYFKEMTVLKVMFTAIVTAAVLIFWSVALGLLDYDAVWVNPTYLPSGILGGIIMGVGFVIGGYCPGTSLVAASTLKLDAFFFVGGIIVGVFFFGESAGLFKDFFEGGNAGRFTLADWLGVDMGVAVFLVSLMAVVLFWGGDKITAMVQSHKG